ncbi:hypothetical protein LZ554_005729 [Drepanopeziza brunnea f. sp. 'monogermtubi']|nr:hypothetical protein LZ554_005729 [Drepanopeziza brunnea f. sp. 'monogermtubi']
MQRVTSLLPSWDKTKTGSKKGFDKAWGWADKLGAPVNRFSNKIGSEAFWPSTLDRESDKAARILRSFCKDGFYAEEDRPSILNGPKNKQQRVLKKIPQKVIKDAVGLAIFTTMRTGLWISGAGGSGVLVARKEDGEWSPPSGIMLHTAGLGFLVGVDIYDCVVVINNRKALAAFTKVRATLGGEISAVAGPVGVGGLLENDGKWKQANRPVFTYLKSRGFYAGVQVDGTVIIERNDENERFYGQRLGVAEILAGKVRQPPVELKMLMETLKAAEGRSDIDKDMMEELEDQPAPGDVSIEEPGPTAPISIFGVPEPDDPDPYGVLALEAEGFEIREAGSKSRPSSTQFEFNPSPTSPIYPKLNRRSIDTLMTTRSNRESYMSNRSYRIRTSTDKALPSSETGTQTDDRLSPNTSPSRSDQGHPIFKEEKPIMEEPEEIDYTKIDLSPLTRLNHSDEFDGTTVNDDRPRGRSTTGCRKVSIDTTHTTHTHTDSDSDSLTDLSATDDEEDDDDYEEEEPVIFETASAQAQVITPSDIKARGGVVNIPKRPPPPPVPPRSRARPETGDRGSGKSPAKSTSEGSDLAGVERQSVEVIPSSIEPVKASKLEENRPGREKAIPNIEQPIVMDDLEKADTKETVIPGSFESQVEHELEIEHMAAGVAPAITREEAAKLEGEQEKVPTETEKLGINDLDEKDEFHSAPAPMPFEVSAVKAATAVV